MIMSQLPENTKGYTGKENTFEAYPAGDYIGIIESSEFGETSTGGEMLTLIWQIIEGNFKGKKVYERLNLVNKNTGTEQQAWRAWNAIKKICGYEEHVHVPDASVCYNIPIGFELSITGKDDDPYGKQNRFKKHYAVGTNTAQTQQQPEQNNAPSAAPGKNPWDR